MAMPLPKTEHHTRMTCHTRPQILVRKFLRNKTKAQSQTSPCPLPLHLSVHAAVCCIKGRPKPSRVEYKWAVKPLNGESACVRRMKTYKHTNVRVPSFYFVRCFNSNNHAAAKQLNF